MICRCSIILLCFCSSVLASGQKSYTVTGDSMSPALTAGDTVTVETGSDTKVQRGDLVSIRIEADKTPLVKRVVAVAGDKIEFKEGVVLVNGDKVGAFDATRWQATVRQLERSNWIVPAGFLFILGDNPANSRDSKRLGLIATIQVEGKVVRVIKKDR